MDFKLPELGEGVYEAELVRWLAEPGAAVRMGQNLLEVLTDKATMEVPSPFTGTVDELLKQPGDVLKVGEAVLHYTPSGAGASAQVAEAAPERKPAPARRPESAPPPKQTPASVKASPSV